MATLDDGSQQQPSSENAEDTPAGNKVQLDDGVTTTVLSVRGWQARWEAGHTGWTEKEGNRSLRNHLNLFADSSKSLKVFVPLCGNAVEMKWFYDLGHTVVGVDGFEGALLKFFKDHDMEYTSSKLSDDIILFQSMDGRLRLYACDIYMFSSVDEKLFDAVWDRGSLMAINRSEREKYAQLLVSLMAPQCQYLLCIVEYDATVYPGPPHSLTLEDVRGLYEGFGCLVKLLDARNALEEKFIKMGLSSIEEKLYLISFA